MATVDNGLTYKVIGAAIALHKTLGPGLLESVYEHSLAHDLKEMGLKVQQQAPVHFHYKDVKLEVGFRIDIVIEDKLIVEVKSVDAIHEVHKAQLLTYLKLANIKLGLLINFNSLILKDNIYRYIN